MSFDQPLFDQKIRALQERFLHLHRKAGLSQPTAAANQVAVQA